jgi:hypothetical protein
MNRIFAHHRRRWPPCFVTVVAGVARLTETAPVHARGISDLFVARLDDHELAVLESVLGKVTLSCTFG